LEKDVVLSARIPEKMRSELSELAEATDRPIAWHVEKALAAYVDLNRWQVAAIQDGLEQARAGKFVSLESAKAWVESWGTAHEKPRPKSGRGGEARRKR
jgi:RHH-type transcriptional regulator, rel operon repressor / antitoxin RelB